MVPETIRDTAQLDELLSEPTPGLVELMQRLPGDILVLGAAGKMGPSLSRMAVRAAEAAGTPRRVIAVSRFSSPGSEQQFTDHGIEIVKADLLDREQLAGLPDAPNVVYMAGMKFGSTGNESLTWAMNAFLPGMVCQRYPDSRIAAFPTGNIYQMKPIAYGGAIESDTLQPVGEYAMSCLGRERVFDHFSRTAGTPVALVRLNYAVEMRYGVLVDVARQVWAGAPVSVAMGVANVIWQADANAMALGALEHAASPAFPINVAGPEQISIRRVAEQYGELMGKTVTIEGEEAPNALISNGQLGHRLFGYPRIGIQQMMRWIADWVMRGGESLGKPTHFEVRDGKY